MEMGKNDVKELFSKNWLIHDAMWYNNCVFELYTHSAVEECAVIGRPHGDYGEAVTAFVKIKQGRNCSEGSLIDFCKERIASYKAPKKILFVAELPKSPTGKILKRKIRRTF